MNEPESAMERTQGDVLSQEGVDNFNTGFGGYASEDEESAGGNRDILSQEGVNNFNTEFGGYASEDEERAGENRDILSQEGVNNFNSETVAESGAAKSDGNKYAHLVVFTAHKAGMDKVDKDKILQVIHEASKGSKFYANALQQNKKHMERLSGLKKKLKSCPPSIFEDQGKYEAIVRNMEKERFLDRWWCVVDFDCFYAAVAMRDNPSLIGKPIAVGGQAMISTANYEARKYGVRSAMPGFIARKLCPQLIFVKSDWKAYRAAAELARNVFRRIDPNFTTMSLDEASLDMTPYLHRAIKEENGDLDDHKFVQRRAEEIVQSMRKEVSIVTNGLTISAGLACNRMLAKIASDFNKPNGQCVIPNTPVAILNFMSPLGIRKIPGVGKVTEHIVKEVLGCTTCRQLMQPSPALQLYHLFKQDTARFILKSALGISSTTRESDSQIHIGPSQKGISNERTFSEISKPEKLFEVATALSQSLSEQMKAKGLMGKTMTLKLKRSSFSVSTRQTTLPNYTDDGAVIAQCAKALLRKEFPISLRLMGIRVSHFKGAAEPLPANQKQMTKYLKSSSSPDKKVEQTNTPTPSTADTHVTCEKCNKSIKLGQLFEHEDWHVAKEVKRKMYKKESFPAAGAATTNTSGKRKQRSIVGFFGSKRKKG